MAHQPRRFDNLRARPPKPISAEGVEPIEATARRLFSSPDGQRVLQWLVIGANEVTPLGASDATLREAEGARRFMDRTLKAISSE